MLRESNQITNYPGVKSLLSRIDNCEFYETPLKKNLIILPTCTKPLEYFYEENWAIKTQVGNKRSVFSIDILKSGIKPGIVVKSPERILTKDKTLLSKKYPWWGGRKSFEKRTSLIIGSPIVEEQVIWEAVFLSRLHSVGIKAELPQALLIKNDGSIELVVNEIKDASSSMKPFQLILTEKSIFRRSGLIPEDYHRFNILEDDNGSCIIDVNRWSWPPYTDDFIDRLIKVAHNSPESSTS